MKPILIVFQLLINILLIGAIALQAKGTGLGSSIMGGSGEFYSSKRGVERIVFIGTIVLAGLFAILSLSLLILS